MAETGDHVGMRRGSVTRALAISWIAALSVVLLIAIATTIFGNPHAGDPVVRMSVSVGGERRAAGKPLNYVLIPGPTNSTPASAPAATPVEIAKPVYAGRALVADPSLIETTQAGPLPKISRDGRTPMIAYAGAIPPASKRPRIAIIISGLGISAKQTEAALESLPPAVTFAFAPYADDVRHWVAAARGLGHEVLLQVPMEAYELPDHDPGPHTLRANQDSAANIQRLDWALGRFTGYVGVTNMEGGHFLADPEALAPVLQDLSKRGLLFSTMARLCIPYRRLQQRRPELPLRNPRCGSIRPSLRKTSMPRSRNWKSWRACVERYQVRLSSLPSLSSASSYGRPTSIPVALRSCRPPR